MRSLAIVIRRAYFEAKKRRKYAKNVVVNMSDVKIGQSQLRLIIKHDFLGRV